MTDEKPTGRLLGGLHRFRDSRAGALLRSERARETAWTLAGGVIGAVIGLIFVSVYLAYR
jgi:hypothetical protein